MLAGLVCDLKLTGTRLTALQRAAALCQASLAMSHATAKPIKIKAETSKQKKGFFVFCVVKKSAISGVCQ
jgi:hypothetical protein